MIKHNPKPIPWWFLGVPGDLPGVPREPFSTVFETRRRLMKNL